MGKLKKTPRSSTASGTGIRTGTGTPPHSPWTSTRATAATPSHTSTSRASAPIPLRSAAHLNAPVSLSETVVSALDDVAEGSTSTSISPGGLTTVAASPPAGSPSSASSPSSPRLYRTRIASTSTIASHEGETLSTMSTSSGSAGSALSKLRSRLELDQAAREDAATRGASTTKLRKRSSRRPVSVEDSDRLHEATTDQNDGTAVVVVAEADAHEAHDPPDVPLEHVVFPDQVVPETTQVQPVSHEPTSPGPVQLPVEEVLAPVSEPPSPPEPDFALDLDLDLEPNRPPLSTPRSLSSSAVSLLFAPVRLGWRVTTAPARITYRLATFGVGVVGSGISLGQKVAQVGLETATEAGSDLGNVFAARTANSNGAGGPKGSESRPTALLRLRDTVSPTRLALAALRVSLGMVIASVLVARALVELAVTKVCGQT